MKEEPSNFIPDVVVVGVGFVGLTLAMSLCSNGLTVLGLEKRENIRKELSKGITNIREPGIEEILGQCIENGSFHISENLYGYSRGEKKTVFILTVGTPILNRKVDNAALINAILEIKDFLRDNDLLIVRSTVAIGTCRKLILPILNQIGLKINLAMCPERTVEGNAMEEIRCLPQIVGGVDTESTEDAVDFFEKLCHEVIKVSSIESAELLKLANNTYRDLNFAFANELTLLASKIGISSREVINAANHNYPRSMIASPGPSGGPCLEKDPWILYESGISRGITMEISKASRVVNESSTLRFVSECLDSFDDSLYERTVGLLGLSFKGEPKVQDARGAFSAQIINHLSSKNYRFFGFEPAGPVEIANIHLLTSIEEVLKNCEVMIIANKSPEFREIPMLLAKSESTKIQLIVDMWGILLNSNLPKGIQYKSWG